MTIRSLAITVVTMFALIWPLSHDSLAQPAVPEGIWMDRAELAALPTSGAAWSNLVQKAQPPCPRPNLSDPDDPANVCVMAKALVFARVGDPVYRLEVIDAVGVLVNGGNYNGRALALGRELAASCQSH